jgi:hypothetical protein
MEGTAVKKKYQVISQYDTRALARWLAKNGQGLLPLVELVEGAELALEELIDVTGRATIEAVLELSALQVAGEPHRGRRGGKVLWHGSQLGQVRLAERKLKVRRMRLRRRGEGPGGKCRCQPTRRSRPTTAPARGCWRSCSAESRLATTPRCGISRSAVSREFIAASEDELKALCERRLEGVEILIIIDGIRFGEQQVIVALGVDPKGQQHLLGLREGATENATVATELLEDLVARGLDPRQRLFVIDGSKALRAAINRVFGERVAVQRCRNHKLRSVLDYLPKELKPQVASVMRAALGLGAEQGIAKLKQQAQWAGARLIGTRRPVCARGWRSS